MVKGKQPLRLRYNNRMQMWCPVDKRTLDAALEARIDVSYPESNYPFERPEFGMIHHQDVLRFVAIAGGWHLTVNLKCPPLACSTPLTEEQLTQGADC